MSQPTFTHLHVHSQYSLLDGKASIPELVDKCLATGMRGIALTDHGNMFGIKEFFNYVEKKNGGLPDDEKFKPILGCEMYVARDKMTDKKDKSDNGYHLIVLAKNLKGYHNLVKLVSKAWTEGYYYKPRTDRDELAKHREGLIVCSACLGGEVPQFIMHEEFEKAEERILWYKSVFGDDYYLELQRHQTFKENANREVYVEQCKVNEHLIRYARKHNIKLVATNDVHFTNEDDAEAHDRLICVSMQKKFSEPRLHYTKQEWLKTPEEMYEIFKDIPEALETTQEILDKVEFYTINHAPIMPFFDIPKEFGTEEEYRARLTEKDLFDEFTQDENGNVVLSEEDAKKKIERLGGYDKLYRIKFEADYLNKLTLEGAKERYGDPIPPDVMERLKFELYIMKTMGFPGYFLIVQDFINTARKELGVSVGPGRGSAAGSAAAYCLGITQIDPIKYDLLFERFLNPDRISLPDIDVDFDDDGRYEVLKYVTRKYGAEKVAHIITFGTMATKMAIKDVAKVLEVPLPESNRLARLVPDRMPEVDGKTPKVNFKNCLKYVPEFAAEKQNPEENIRETMKYAEQLEGNIRNTGVHACGVIISRDDITDWVPVSMGTDADGEKVISTQYEGSIIEDTGLIKMDFLGLKTLSIIKETLNNIKARFGKDLDIEKIPLDDKETFELYCKGNTTSTFQFESAGMQNSLRSLKPSKFEDLIAMNALYRPGPMDYIPAFIARKHGEEEIVYDIPCMKQYLEETYGITVYQEQVMLLSRLLANFTRGESDTLRKAMGKKLIDKMNHLKGKFLEGGQANGHKPEILEKIWADWEKFASYAFNKSHATCYSWVAFQTAYLKANYPAEYMAAVLTRNRSDIVKLTNFMDECKAMKIPVKGPDVNESFTEFGVNSQGDIRFGLAAIKGVGDNVVSAIIRTREEGGRFESPFDFVERVPCRLINRRVFDSLVLSGAFDWYPDIKREDYFEKNNRDESFSDQLLRYGQMFQNAKEQAANSLFDDMEEMNTAGRPEVKSAVPWVDAVKLEKERELVGMYLSAHPLDRFYMELNYGMKSVKDFTEALPEEGKELTFGGMVTKFVERPTRTGGNFAIITMEDYTGSTEIRLFGQKYIDFAKYGREGTPVVVTVRAESRYNKPPEFSVVNMRLLNDVKGKLISGVTVSMTRDAITPTLTDVIRDQFESRNSDAGKGHLTFRIFDPDANRWLRMSSAKRIPMDRQLVNILDSLPVEYQFEM